MDYKIIDIEGIGPKYAEKLQAAGIKTSADLLEKGKTVKGRKELAEATGISGKRILTWVNHCDLYRINGVGPQFAELLEASGVDTVTEFAYRNPANLERKMKAVNEAKHLTRRVPTVAELEKMIAQAKELPRVMTYGKAKAVKVEKPVVDKTPKEEPKAETTEPKVVCIWDDENTRIADYDEFEGEGWALKDQHGNWLIVDEDNDSEPDIFSEIDEWCGLYLVSYDGDTWTVYDDKGDYVIGNINDYEDEGYRYLTLWQDGDELHLYPDGHSRFASMEEDDEEEDYDDDDWDEED